jgi:hypothetical protein
VCHHKIHVQCYVSKSNDPDTLIVLGNCCVYNYLCKLNRTCDDCQDRDALVVERRRVYYEKSAIRIQVRADAILAISSAYLENS